MGRKLNPEQIKAITIMSRTNGLTDEQIAEEVGVSRMTLYRWKQQDSFYNELKREITRKTIDRLPEVLESVPDHIIKDGNAAMLRTFLQMHGMLTDKVEVDAKDTLVDIEAIREKLREAANEES